MALRLEERDECGAHLCPGHVAVTMGRTGLRVGAHLECSSGWADLGWDELMQNAAASSAASRMSSIDRRADESSRREGEKSGRMAETLTISGAAGAEMR